MREINILLRSLAVVIASVFPALTESNAEELTEPFSESSRLDTRPAAVNTHNRCATDENPMFAVGRKPEKARSAFWFPALSFFLPGLDQWWEGQWGPALAYTGTAAASYAYVDLVRRRSGLYERERRRRVALERGDPAPTDDGAALDSKDALTRKISLAAQVSQWAGGMSTYHSFRTSVRTRRPDGEYEFLGSEETPWDIMLSPFRFDYVVRPTTFIPLAIISGLSLISQRQPVDDASGLERSELTGEDAFYSGGFSYNAGTHEEAVFRGWLQPWLMQQWGSPFWSNSTQAVAFGMAHLNTNPLPVIQTLLGFHLGWVTQRNSYRIGEAVFIHAWWNVAAFLTSYSYREKQEAAGAIMRRGPTYWLPPFAAAI